MAALDELLSQIAALLKVALGEVTARAGERLRIEQLLSEVERARASMGPADERCDAAIAQAADSMRARCGQSWTVSGLARRVGLSRAAFARRFTLRFGVAPMRYLHDLRMREAARLLQESDAGLARIASEVGYESEFAFSRAFKRHSGEAPGTFRKQARAAERVRCIATRSAA